MPLLSCLLMCLCVFVSACRKEGSDTTGTAATAQSAVGPHSSAVDLYALSARELAGQERPLALYRGQVALVVNTASECGFTPQYAGLERLYRRYRDQGFVVLGFPSDDFGGQEPGTEEAIATFTRTRYGITFPLFAKVHASEEKASGVFSLLGRAFGFPTWNFHKYLVSREGRPIAAFSSLTEPESAELRTVIEQALSPNRQ